MEEIWKDIPGYEGLYQASNTGFIRSLGNKTHSGIHLIKLREDKDGYLFLRLWKNSKPKDYRCHRLIYLTFKGKIPKGMQINHIDENKKNNNNLNLEVMSCKENINYGTGIKRRAAQVKKPVKQYSLSGEYIQTFLSVEEAAEAVKGHHALISKCCLHRPHCITASGYKWEYA